MVVHARCANGANCVISVNGGGAHLSPLCPKPYCIPCGQKRKAPKTK